jgi:hypothetical protein
MYWAAMFLIKYMKIMKKYINLKLGYLKSMLEVDHPSQLDVRAGARLPSEFANPALCAAASHALA